MTTNFLRRVHPGFFIFLFCFALHLWNIGSGLPNFYNSDEPHHLNIAAHFGTGDLNPHDFKYPTFWPYLISVVFGIFFVLGRFLGLVQSTADFAQHFFYTPTVFYLSIRILSAFFLSLAPWVFTHVGFKYYSRPVGILMGLFSCLCPILLIYGRHGTHYGVMVFMVSVALYELHGLLREGGWQHYLRSGFFLGLATSIHYIAAPLALLIPALYLCSQKEKSILKPLLAWAAMAVGFFLCSPYALLDVGTFSRDVFALRSLQDKSLWVDSSSYVTRLLSLGHNVVYFIDPWGIGFLMIIGGFLVAPRKQRYEFLAWISPLLITTPYLARLHFGDLLKYSIAAYTPLFIIAAYGLAALVQKISTNKKGHAIIFAIIFIPLSIQAMVNLPRRIPDTRTLSKEWILRHVPRGSKLFVSDRFNGPQLPFARTQLERLLLLTEKINHPRKHYYRLLLEGAQNDGYELFYLKESTQEVLDVVHRTELSQQAQDLIDLNQKDGLSAIRSAGIQYVVLEEMVLNWRKDSAWLIELQKNYSPIKSFSPALNQVSGPDIFIYDIQSPSVEGSRAEPAS